MVIIARRRGFRSGRRCRDFVSTTVNPVLYKIARMDDENLLRCSIQLLYVQAVLLSHRPLNEKELALLNEGLLGLIEQGADIFVTSVQ